MSTKNDGPLNDQSIVYCEGLVGGDWFISVHLSDADGRHGLFSEEAATAELAAQLACRLRRVKGDKPAVLLRGSLPEFDFHTHAVLQLVQSSVLDQGLQRRFAAVRAKGSELIVCDDFLQLRNATSIVALYPGALLATTSSSEMFLTIIESGEGIGLRCSRGDDVRKAIHAAVASLGYDVRTTKGFDPEWAQKFIDEIAAFIPAMLDIS